MRNALSSIDLNLLVALQALLAERSVTRAAARLSLSQSATSHALARLRELYQDPLLVRSGRHMDLTPRAVALLPQLDRGLGDLAGTLSGEPPFAPATARRSFTINMADYSQAVTLVPLLARLRSQAPGVDLVIVSFPNSLEMLEAGTADLAIQVNATMPSGFSEQPLYSDGFVTMARVGHPRMPVRRRRLSLSCFLGLDHLVVAPTGSAGSMVDTVLERAGRHRRIAVRVSNFLTAPLIVSQSDLVSTGPERLWRKMVDHFSVRLFAPPIALPNFTLHAVWHARRDQDPAHRWIRQQLIEASQL